MSRSLDLTHVNEMFKSDKEVNLPPDALERELQKREAMAKKKAQEQTLENKVKSLKRIEKKTDKLIKKAKQTKNNSDTTRTQPQYKPPTTRIQSKREESLNRRETVETHVEPVTNPVATREPLPRPAPSITDYHMLNRNPKKVMKFIMSAFSASGSSEKTVFIDTYELKDETGLSAESIRQVFIILKKNGYIEVERSRSNGMRMVSINDSLLQ